MILFCLRMYALIVLYPRDLKGGSPFKSDESTESRISFGYPFVSGEMNHVSLMPAQPSFFMPPFALWLLVFRPLFSSWPVL